MLQIDAVNVEVVMLLSLLRTVILGLLTVGLVKLIELCLSEDMIFWKWTVLLNYLWIKNWRKKDRWKRYFLKPLGLCHYCYGTWVAIFVYTFIVGIDIAIFVFLGSWFLWLMIIEKWFEKHEYRTEEKEERNIIKGFKNE